MPPPPLLLKHIFSQSLAPLEEREEWREGALHYYISATAAAPGNVLPGMMGPELTQRREIISSDSYVTTRAGRHMQYTYEDLNFLCCIELNQDMMISVCKLITYSVASNLPLDGVGGASKERAHDLLDLRRALLFQ